MRAFAFSSHTQSRGFESTTRGNELAQKIVASDIELGLDSYYAFYAPDNCMLVLPLSDRCSFVAVIQGHSLMTPYNLPLTIICNALLYKIEEILLIGDHRDPVLPFTVNGVQDPTSQRFHVTLASLRSRDFFC